MNTRPVKEIQRAHDLIIPILLGEVKLALSEDRKLYIHCVADVLCWCLNHDHNDTFAKNLRNLERDLAQHGYQLEDHGN